MEKLFPFSIFSNFWKFSNRFWYQHKKNVFDKLLIFWSYATFSLKFWHTIKRIWSKNIFACLFSVHNTISLSRHEKVCLIRLRFERYFLIIGDLDLKYAVTMPGILLDMYLWLHKFLLSKSEVILSYRGLKKSYFTWQKQAIIWKYLYLVKISNILTTEKICLNK